MSAAGEAGTPSRGPQGAAPRDCPEADSARFGGLAMLRK